MKVIFGDITDLDCDAIVNAANSSLLGGGGVDGAIHRAAGHELVHECRILGGCKPGMAKITKGYQLKARHIIHTVGPVWNGGIHNEEDTLASCYLNSLLLCLEHKISSVAFPCISTGIYGFPKEKAAQIAVKVCREFTEQHPLEITFCCYEREDYNLYTELLSLMKLDIDKFRGALLGLAVGDALGTTVEFSPRGSFAPMTDIIGGGPFDLKPGEWTDDTSMALCLGESLTDSKGMNLRDQLDRYCDWWINGHNSVTDTCFDIGNTVRRALENFGATDNVHSGSVHPLSSGNGSIMRLAPVPLYYAHSPATACEAAAESSRTTHGSEECLNACRLFSSLIIGALQGIKKEQLLSENFYQSLSNTPDLCPSTLAISKGSYKCKPLELIKGSGYVIESLEAALWAFWNSENFEDGALLAVNLGDDADTTGAVYGQIAGAYYGMKGIPKHWLKILAWKERITTLADNLHSAAMNQESHNK